ncbi:MAG: cell division protein SepF [Lachnospiraceae bacterium]|nr:cell division protein SepF [Lachnospiraceae bacterium]
MGNGINKFLDMLKLTDEDDYDDMYEDDYEIDEKELRKEEKRLKKEQKEQYKEDRRTSYSKNDYDEEPEQSFSERRSSQKSYSSKVVPIRSSSSGFDINIMRPSNFGDSQQVCEILLNGQPVVVNLEGIDIGEAQRIMDFVSGCIFSISGTMRQVSRYIFVFAPKNIDISGDYIKNVASGDDGINIPSININKEF